MYDYHKPFYFPYSHANLIAPLSAWGDNSTTFITAKYRIRPEYFPNKTQYGTVFPPMREEMDYSGRPVFPGWVDKSKYRLLSEQIIHQPFYDEVIETYGFTPDKNFRKVITATWTRPAIRNAQSFSKKIDVGNDSITTADDGSLTLRISNSVSVGQVVNLECHCGIEKTEGDYSYNVYYDCRGESTITSNEFGEIVISAFNWECIPDNGEGEKLIIASNDEKAPQRTESITVYWTESREQEYIDVQSANVNKTDNYVEIFIDGDASRFCSVGDALDIMASFIEYNVMLSYKWWSAGEARNVPVYKVSGNKITVPYFETTYTSEKGSIDYHILSYPYVGQLSSDYYRGFPTRLINVGQNRTEYSGEFSAIQTTDFVRNTGSDFIIEQPFAPTLGASIVSYVSDVTNPTSKEYAQMIDRKDDLLIAPENYTLLMGDIYARTRITIKAQ